MAAPTANPDDEAHPAGLTGPAGAPPSRIASHPAVGLAWSALDDAGIRWALLRGNADGEKGDIDVLVAPMASRSKPAWVNRAA